MTAFRIFPQALNKIAESPGSVTAQNLARARVLVASEPLRLPSWALRVAHFVILDFSLPGTVFSIRILAYFCEFQMEMLAHRVFLSLFDFLQSIYAPRTLSQFRAHVISALPRLVFSEVTGYNEVNVRTQHNVPLCSPAEALDFPDSKRLFDQHIHEHPIIARARNHDERVLKFSDFLSDAQYQRLGL